MPLAATLRWPLAAALVALTLALATDAGAQTKPPADPPPALTPLSPGEPPAYDAQLLRLSEILGAMHYLRKLCGGDEGGLWREQMQALIDAEQPDPERRARFVDRFNRGFESFRAVYRACTPAATLAIERYMDEGARIARDITARYGKER